MKESMTFTEKAWSIFEQAVRDYHKTDSINAVAPNPFTPQTIEYDLYRKCWIDAAQWHMEDLIRDPEIDPKEGMELKHRIDKSNQDRTDLVELIDSYFLTQFIHVKPLPGATINTETPAWAVDRLSILSLKIWHMREQADRPDASAEHKERSMQRLNTLLEQKRDLCGALDTLLDDLAAGRKVMKLYKQMKLYNDPETNPVLYKK